MRHETKNTKNNNLTELCRIFDNSLSGSKPLSEFPKMTNFLKEQLISSLPR